MYIYCIYSRCILYRSICPLVVQLYTLGRGCQSPNPQEMHCFKWEFCV